VAALARRPHGGLEQEILACLTFAGRPMTAAQVLTDLGGGLAYTTVMTALGRLHDKHAVTRQQSVRAYVYALPLGGPHASATAHRMMRLLEGGTDRAGVLARFVAALRPEDEQLLADLIAQDQHIPEDGHP
jgi:predicted transcriptional regulator